MALKDLRTKIDRLDEKIVDLINRRTEIALRIGEVKKKLKREIYAPDREKEVYRRITSLNKGPLPAAALKAIFREIMSGAISLEKRLKIAYLGPPASFTHVASMLKFGASIEYVPAGSIADAFASVERGHADYGVVPIENSIEGAVNYTLDMLVDSNLKICSEIITDISHCLVGSGTLDSVTRIYSKVEVFGQCRSWILANFPKAELLEVSSTSKAAELVRNEPSSAAIASELAASLYGVKILERFIEDSPHNITRFLVVGKSIPKRTGHDKTSVMISIKDRVGGLHDVLVPFRDNNINLTKIESRPSRRKAWDYYFFVDLRGHCRDRKVKKALNELEEHCEFVKLLGSYPQSE